MHPFIIISISNITVNTVNNHNSESQCTTIDNLIQNKKYVRTTMLFF